MNTNNKKEIKETYEKFLYDVRQLKIEQRNIIEEYKRAIKKRLNEKNHE